MAVASSSSERDVEMEDLRDEVQKLREEIMKRDKEIARLQQGNNELQSLLLRMKQTELKTRALGLFLPRDKKPAVSGESSQFVEEGMRVELKSHPKDSAATALIREALLKNDFMKNLEPAQMAEMIDCMRPKTYEKDQFIIREGWPGTELYVTASGEVEVRQQEKKLRTIGPGSVIGELAVLYNCTRTATIITTQATQVWCLERQAFQTIMMRTGLKRQEDYKNFLRKVSTFRRLPDNLIGKVADSLEEDQYADGEFIVRQGGVGDTFYIIRSGSVEITQTAESGGEPKHLRFLAAGETFGELALLRDERRTANAIAKGKVNCLVLERGAFHQLIGNLEQYSEATYIEEQERKAAEERKRKSTPQFDSEFMNMKLGDLQILGTLGVGGFGRVELVNLKTDKTRSFALKCLKKKHIVETRQQEHVFNEKRIMLMTKSPFVVRLFRTFRDSRYLYFLMESCLGGELWTVLRDMTRFDDPTARFYTACVIEAFEYLHSKGVIYRDLKPENLLLDVRGYVKLVDFGFAKKIGFGRKTWTFCGTPEYVAPEIILNKGHDFSSDYWSLGILMFELLTGTPPFTGEETMQTYNIILKGLDRIDFPRIITRNAHNLIRKLCRDNPSERLGNQKDGIKDIKRHRWFSGLDWAGLVLQRVKPPFVPKVKSSTDMRNFDSYPAEKSLPAEDHSGWDETF